MPALFAHLIREILLSFPYFSMVVYASQLRKSKQAKNHLHLPPDLPNGMLYQLLTLEIRNQVSSLS